MEHDGFHGEKLNACAMNNLDEYIYCVLQAWPGRRPTGFQENGQ